MSTSSARRCRGCGTRSAAARMCGASPAVADGDASRRASAEPAAASCCPAWSDGHWCLGVVACAVPQPGKADDAETKTEQYYVIVWNTAMIPGSLVSNVWPSLISGLSFQKTPGQT